MKPWIVSRIFCCSMFKFLKNNPISRICSSNYLRKKNFVWFRVKNNILKRTRSQIICGILRYVRRSSYAICTTSMKIGFVFRSYNLKSSFMLHFWKICSSSLIGPSNFCWNCTWGEGGLHKCLRLRGRRIFYMISETFRSSSDEGPTNLFQKLLHSEISEKYPRITTLNLQPAGVI